MVSERLGGGDTGHVGHIKWAVIMGASGPVYTYVISSPNIRGLAQFTGHYMFQGDIEERVIGGDSVVITNSFGNYNGKKE